MALLIWSNFKSISVRVKKWHAIQGPKTYENDKFNRYISWRINIDAGMEAA